MQELSAALTAALLTIDARVTPRVLVDLYELYSSDAIPGIDGFDPADAIEAFAAESITWNGEAYRRELKANGGRSDITKNMNEKTNQVTLNFSNISRYCATWASTTQIEGLFLVIRTVVPSVTDDSIVLFVGRCDKPSDIDKKQFTLSAHQDFGNINQEVPPREFTAEDPMGRTPSDLLYEGFRIIAFQGQFPVLVNAPSTSFFGRLFGRTNTSTQNRQWSSLDGTPYGSAVPMIFGRCQMQLIPILFADIGYFLVGIWVVGEGRIEDFTDVRIRDANLSLIDDVHRFGDPGGTGSNVDSTFFFGPTVPVNHGYLSNTAYAILSTRSTEAVDDAPTITAIVKGLRVPVPNSSGVWGGAAWSDNPVNIARFILTDPRLVGINPGFMEDAVNYATALHCDEALIDDSNGEVTLIPTAELPQAGTGITRYRSTGILDPNYYRYHHILDSGVVPEFTENDYTGYDLDNIPNFFAANRLLRKRYTFNAPLTEKTRATDFFHKVVCPVAKLFLRINKRGKYEIRSEVPSDATHVRFATAVNATAIRVQDVVPWKTGDLLQGRIMLGFGLITSEVRDVSSATFTADGNAITLTTGVTGGGVTSVASGATLTGGSTTVQASGTITVGGTPAPGNTITVTINGIVVTYTVGFDETAGSVAAMLAAYINATPKLRRFIKATWDVATPTVITIQAKYGVLNVAALLKAHTGPIADPTASPVLASSAGALEAGTYKVAYSDVTALGKTALSPTVSIVITASKKIDVSALALVGASRNWYMSDAANSDYLKHVANTNGAAFSLTALPLPGAALPPSYNTTAEELLRVAGSFATNSQDVYSVWPASTLLILNDIYLPSVPNGHKYQVTTAGTTGATEPTWPVTAGGTVVSGAATFTEIGATVLGQAGLTRANIKKDTFKFPLGSRQSSVNQVKTFYRDANNDFARTPYRVNDPIHQALVNKIYPMEVNGEGIDNFHQMFRIANWQLAKNREGDWYYTFGTGPQGLVLEEGDVICASDDSGGLVNQVCRIEELRIHPNHDVTIGLARKYSTNMFSDDVGADIIPVPTTLRYVQTVDSLVEFIDNYPIRDADGLTAGFYAAISRDLADVGDWRGSTLYADYGDGDSPIAEIDIPAVMGVATTTLGILPNPGQPAFDPSVWDRINSVTFTLRYGPPSPSPEPFVTVPEQDVLANPRRNLFLVGDEYLQAATVVNNGDQSYTISALLRGRFGTDNSDQLTHGASERVIYLDGSELFVPIDITRLNGPFNYKAVTTNQDVADATPVPFTWTGGNLKPLSPVNLRGTRDTEGSLLIEWTRRSRLSPGLTPGSDVPLSEESESYEVDILTTGSVLKRTIPVSVGGSRAAVLLDSSQDHPELISGNNILASGVSTEEGAAFAVQALTGPGAWVEATLKAPTGYANIYLIPYETTPTWYTFLFPADGFKHRIGFAQTVSPIGIEVREQNVVKFASGSLGSVASVRIRILISGTEIRYYWDYTGPGSVPFYISRVAPLFPLALGLECIGTTASIENVLIVNPTQPSVIYSRDQQIEDFSSIQDPIRVRVKQISAVVGAGPYTQADL